MEDLQLGATILSDYLDLLSEKKAKAEYAAKNAKAGQEEAAIKVRSPIFGSFSQSLDVCLQVKLAFMDDRKKKSLQDELEKERRRTASTSGQLPAVRQRSGTPDRDILMPGSGHLLGIVSDEPPSYEHLETE